jgi:hypothetical protein
VFGLSKRIAMILLSIWLIATGLLSLGSIGFSGAGLMLNLLAIAAGGLILLQGESRSARIGMILLGIWLLARGLLPLVDFSFQGIGLLMNVLAIATGVLILLER